MLKIIAFAALFVIVSFAAYIRLAPMDAARWHNQEIPDFSGENKQLSGGFLARYAVADDAAAELARLDEIIRATPRTRMLAGSLDAGRLTYVTRSRIMGFPDYSTLAIGPDGTLLIHGRLRFGKSDLGVNRARIIGWLAQLDAAG